MELISLMLSHLPIVVIIQHFQFKAVYNNKSQTVTFSLNTDLIIFWSHSQQPEVESQAQYTFKRK